MKIGSKVKLTSFNGGLTPDEDCFPHENYWKLIGRFGVIANASNDKKNRLLVQFEDDLHSLGLECHNDLKNSLWILISDLTEI
jgi:hypothetical protein